MVVLPGSYFLYITLKYIIYILKDNYNGYSKMVESENHIIDKFLRLLYNVINITDTDTKGKSERE